MALRFHRDCNGKFLLLKFTGHQNTYSYLLTCLKRINNKCMPYLNRGIVRDSMHLSKNIILVYITLQI